ncbi:MAG: clostripain-related cysteine peptidase [Caldilineaceae bacterium]
MKTQNVKMPCGVRLWLGCLCALALGLWMDVPRVYAAERPSKPPSAVAVQTVPDCSGVTAVPLVECRALLRLYADTKGGQWDNNSHWGDVNAADAPCQWFGVTCQDGHVTQINLASNHLHGELPDAIGNFNFLTHLLVQDNQLRDPIPRAICELTDTLVQADFSYNQLYTNNSKTRQCMQQLAPDTLATQTVKPTKLHVAAITESSIQLAWTPIAYTGDGGFYEISYSPTITGPFTVHGVTADKLAASYLLDNLTPGQSYFMRVRTHTPTHPQQENDQWSPDAITSAVTGSAQKVLLIVYFPGDNDLSPYMNGVLQKLRLGTAYNPTLQIVFLGDRIGDHNTRLFTIENGVITQTDAVETEWGVDELDTTDPAVLSWFLRFARSQYPATRTLVSMMGHGVGMAPEFSWLVSDAPGEPPTPQPGIPALPKDIPNTPGDFNDQGGFLSPLDYGRALGEATNNGADPFDLIFFDQCFMGNLDALYEVRKAADVFVASPNYAWLLAAYRAYATQFAPTASAERMASGIINFYQAGLTDRQPNSIFWIRSQEITDIAGAVNNLGDALTAALAAGADAQILNAALASQFVDSNQCGSQNLVLGPPDELIGARSFARSLQDQFPSPSPVYAAAETLRQMLINLKSTSRTGTPYIAPDTEWDYQDTLTILAPLQRDLTADVVWRASIYTETLPLTADWSPSPTQTLSITDTFAFVKEGRWDNFINAWYTADLKPTVGEWCNYSPPVLATDGVSETISLTVQAAGELVQLNWDASALDDAAEYWIFERNAETINWVLLDTQALSSTVYTTKSPAPGAASEFIVQVQDEEGSGVGVSNAVVFEAPPLDEPRFYLPIIAK